MKRALILNAASPEGAHAASALADHALTILDKGLPDQAAWEDFATTAETQGLRFDTIVHCPRGGTGPDGVEEEILSAWLTAKFANRICASGEPALITLLRRADGPAAIDTDAAANGIRYATWSAMLDASRRGVHLRSNRLTVSPETAPAQVVAALKMLADARASFVAGADIALEPAPDVQATTSLAGKAVLVTGATSGIGRASAIEIGRQGGFVFVGGRKPDLADETLALVREAGGDGAFIRLDVTDASAWEAAAATIRETQGALHGLVNNAGEAKNLPIEDLDEDVLRFLVHLNYGGCRRGMDALLPLLEAGHGSVVNVASVAGMRAGFGGSAYGASKAAMIGLSQSYGKAIAGPRKVRVNAIQPGLIWSEGVTDSLGEDGARQFRTMIEGKTPIGRVGTPDEVGRFVAFLVSDAAAGIHGQALPVSGGLELVHP
ncbi:SDR family NAD(P)-dependent oxidoreductase [Novosphingobium mangrovi (ex Hu et al. 2023)]|uniref:SDR family oxidoreductase n=1 Tax=Novosphingobium mangrovi (ex Hu et al. 2023) TaxID=2930094 RepID=A0ABT0AD16_9SPHN|nr:SDR family NAD(P)-dependent oxidoreductase [Novosphingobium mangrovi (ex Hu et al. 2023)]MCJ1961093.1 SDR family oxidoreductase [Novosphingobium mangrovi (ex Hu et al. 2023)]